MLSLNLPWSTRRGRVHNETDVLSQRLCLVLRRSPTQACGTHRYNNCPGTRLRLGLWWGSYAYVFQHILDNRGSGVTAAMW